MNTSIYIARVFGFFLMIFSLSMFYNFEKFITGITELTQNVSLQLIFGMFLLTIGLLLVVSHNIWKASWVVVVTILSWMVLIKAIIFLFFPEYIQSISIYYIQSNNYIYISALINFLIGLFLCYKSFVQDRRSF